jgi:DNA-binding Lrp family transcriptional regulator
MNDAVLKGFEQAVRDEPEILDCFYVAGSNDYLIRFSYRDAEDLERFHTDVLMAARRGAQQLDAGAAHGEEDDRAAGVSPAAPRSPGVRRQVLRWPTPPPAAPG